MGLRPTQGDENRVEECSVGNYPTFVISTGAQRSGEICGCSTALSSAFLSVIPAGNLLFDPSIPKSAKADSLRE